MPFERPAAEARGEAVEELHRQRDLGQEDQRLLSFAQRFGDGFEIGLGLARPRDAVEQRHGEFPLLHGVAQMLGRAKLIG